MSTKSSTFLPLCYLCHAELPTGADCTTITGIHQPADLHQGRELVEARLSAVLAKSPYEFELVYVDNGDRLTDEGIAEYLSDEPNWDKVYDPEWESDQRYDAAVRLIDEACEYLGITADALDDDDVESLRFWVYDNDQSNPIKDLLRGTPDQLLRYTIADDLEFISGHEADGYERKVAAVREAIEPTGLTVTDAEVFDLVANGPFDWHEAVCLDLIWYGPIDDIPSATAFQITTPHLLLIDPWNGSGFECSAEGTATFPIDAEHRVKLDKAAGGYGWEQIAGTHNPAYRAEATYTTKS